MPLHKVVAERVVQDKEAVGVLEGDEVRFARVKVHEQELGGSWCKQ
jgi:hypothetical protein